MTTARPISGILRTIIERKREDVAQLSARLAELEKLAYERKSTPRSFKKALEAQRPAIIAELKKASPSRGVIAADYHPAFLANAYEAGGAASLSVLTDKEFFQGSLHDLEAARAAVSLPVLRKDFVVDRVQIYEAAAHGADAILLIAAVLEASEMRNFRELATRLGLDALTEVHNREELEKALDSGAEIVGVNNRDLETFEVDLDTSIRLSYVMPSNVLRVSESGIYTRADIKQLIEANFQAFLIGESLIRSADPAQMLRELAGRA